MTDIYKPRVLCVDDEPAVLDGLELTLGRNFDLVTAESGAQALALIETGPEFEVLISDMRMPRMNGAELLARVRQKAPMTTRMLLTGQTEVEAAIAAINEGQIFRFLCKPIQPDALRRAVIDAVQQHRLLSAEKELVEKTLKGAVKTLVDLLSIADPDTFGRAGRIRDIASAVAQRLALPNRWAIELAALLNDLGRITLPKGLSRRLDAGERFSAEEQAMVDRLPVLTDQLLAPIPRLEVVREIQHLARSDKARPRLTGNLEQIRECHLGAEALRLATQITALEQRNLQTAEALSQLKEHWGNPEQAKVFEAAVAALNVPAAESSAVQALQARHLRPGMELVEDLLSSGGQLLLRRGNRITTTFCERVRNTPPNSYKEPVLVILHPEDEIEPEGDDEATA